MKKSLYVLLLCLGSCACLGIVWEWRASLLRQTNLRERLQVCRVQLSKSLKAQEDARQEIGELEKALDNNRHAADILAEEEKWTARLMAQVEALRQERQAHPLPPRKPRAPNPKMGQFFAELLGDPEYKRLAKIVQNKSIRPGWYDDPSLSAEQKARGMDIEFELACSRMERELAMKNLAREDREGRQRVMKEYMARDSALQQDLQALGINNQARIQELVQDPLSGKRASAELLVGQLERRLSYTDSPLSGSQVKQLNDGLAPLLGNSYAERRYSTAAVTNYLRLQVGSNQREALEELIQEAEALDKRQKLPKTP